MKKLLLFLVPMLCVGLMSSCKKDDPATPDSVFMYSTTATVDAGAGTHSVTVMTTCGWEASCESSWVEIVPLSSAEKGIYAVHLNYETNDTGSSRTARIVFTAGSYSETYTLIQSAPTTQP